MNEHHIGYGRAVYSKRFDDVFFSTQDGLAESTYVFLRGNALAQKLSQNPAELVIGETGFGTGLNFLATWALFDRFEESSTQLTFISTEKYPLSADQIRQALLPFNKIQPYAEALLAQYSQSYPGVMDLFLNDRVHLILLIGDASACLKQWSQPVDAWYLDGFSPSKNPHMWSDDLFCQIARLSHHQTTLATFTAASAVRKGLQASCFAINKRKGYGVKREMLTGIYTHNNGQFKENPIAPYFCVPTHSVKPQTGPVAVIGAGLAGTAMAYELSQFGIQADVYEQAHQVAAGASGNQIGMAHPYLSQDANVSDRLFTRGFLDLKSFLQTHGNEAIWQQQSAVEIIHSQKQYHYFTKLIAKRRLSPDIAYVSGADDTDRHFGFLGQQPCIVYPQAIAVCPGALCQRWLQLSQSYVQLYLQRSVIGIQKKPDGWVLQFNDGQEIFYHQVIFAGGYEQQRLLEQLMLLPLIARAGQVDVIAAAPVQPMVLSSGHYYVPINDTQALVGASVRDSDNCSMEPSVAEYQQNLSGFPFSEQLQQSQWLSSRVSQRCTTPDHMPVVGQLPDHAEFEQHYKDALSKGVPKSKLKPCPYHQGLYVTTAFGSKGLSGVMQAAKIIRALMLNHPIPVSADVYQAIHPARFLVRNYKRGLNL